MPSAVPDAKPPSPSGSSHSLVLRSLIGPRGSLHARKALSLWIYSTQNATRHGRSTEITSAGASPFELGALSPAPNRTASPLRGRPLVTTAMDQRYRPFMVDQVFSCTPMGVPKKQMSL